MSHFFQLCAVNWLIEFNCSNNTSSYFFLSEYTGKYQKLDFITFIPTKRSQHHLLVEPLSLDLNDLTGTT